MDFKTLEQSFHAYASVRKSNKLANVKQKLFEEMVENTVKYYASQGETIKDPDFLENPYTFVRFLMKRRFVRCLDSDSDSD